MSGEGCTSFDWHFFRFLAKQVLLTNSSFGTKTKWAAHPRVRRFRLNFFFGSYRSGFRSHFPPFERKRKSAAHPSPGSPSAFSIFHSKEGGVGRQALHGYNMLTRNRENYEVWSNIAEMVPSFPFRNKFTMCFFMLESRYILLIKHKLYRTTVLVWKLQSLSQIRDDPLLL